MISIYRIFFALLWVPISYRKIQCELDVIKVGIEKVQTATGKFTFIFLYWYYALTCAIVPSIIMGFLSDEISTAAFLLWLFGNIFVTLAVLSLTKHFDEAFIIRAEYDAKSRTLKLIRKFLNKRRNQSVHSIKIFVSGRYYSKLVKEWDFNIADAKKEFEKIPILISTLANNLEEMKEQNTLPEDLSECDLEFATIVMEKSMWEDLKGKSMIEDNIFENKLLFSDMDDIN